MYRNVASQVIGAQMVSAATGAAFSSTVSCVVTKDGGAQTAGGGSVAHEGNGFHSYTPTQAETDAGHVAFTFTGTGAIPATVQVYPIVLNDYADALLKRDWTSVTGEAARSVLNALRFLRNKWSISGFTLSIKKEDDVTEAWNSTLTTSASVEAVTTSDPT